jgi:hypothetical protein
VPPHDRGGELLRLSSQSLGQRAANSVKPPTELASFGCILTGRSHPIRALKDGLAEFNEARLLAIERRVLRVH